MPVISVVERSVPDTGTGWCSSTDCSPWTSIAGLKSPSFEKTPPDPAEFNTTGIVGSICWSMSIEFSVVNDRSSVPAPTPRA
jgi:hypothetical protein